VRYEVAYWATPLPDAKDWKAAFDWPTEGENFLNWIRVKAVNTTDQPVEASVGFLRLKGTRSAPRRTSTGVLPDRTSSLSGVMRLPNS